MKKLQYENSSESIEEQQRLKRLYRAKLFELGIVKKKYLPAE